MTSFIVIQDELETSNGVRTSDLPDGRTSGNHQLSPARVSVMFSGRGEADGSGDD